jgi:hypothetical protein
VGGCGRVNDDIISKSRLKQAIRYEKCLCGLGDNYIPMKELEEAMMKAVVGDIKPFIEAAPDVHAYWKLQKMFINASLYHCSNCDHPEMRTYPFCPNCGAKMDRERQGTEE